MKASLKTSRTTTARKPLKLTPSRNAPGDITKANAGRTITINISALRDPTLNAIATALAAEAVALSMLGRDGSHLPDSVAKTLCDEIDSRDTMRPVGCDSCFS